MNPDPRLLDPGILTLALKRILEVILGSFGRLTPSAMRLFWLLVVIELCLLAFAWVLQRDDLFTDLVWFVMKVGAFVLLITQWPRLCEIAINSFARVGLLAGGSTMTVQELTNPSEVMRLGLVAAEPLFLHIKAWGFVSGSVSLADVVIYSWCGLGILVAFAVLALQLFLTFLEFYVVAGLATILVPWGMFRYTAFVGQGALGMVWAHGAKVAMLALVASAAFPVVWTFQLRSAPTWGSSFSLLVGCWAIALLALFAPALAGGMVAGVPRLTLGLATRAAVGAAVGMSLAGSAARTAASASVESLRKAVRLMPNQRLRPGKP